MGPDMMGYASQKGPNLAFSSSLRFRRTRVILALVLNLTPSLVSERPGKISQPFCCVAWALWILLLSKALNLWRETDQESACAGERSNWTLPSKCGQKCMEILRWSGPR